MPLDILLKIRQRGGLCTAHARPTSHAVSPSGDNPPQRDRFRTLLIRMGFEILLRNSMVPGGDLAAAFACARRSARIFSGSTGTESYAKSPFEKLLRFGRKRCRRDAQVDSNGNRLPFRRETSSVRRNRRAMSSAIDESGFCRFLL